MGVSRATLRFVFVVAAYVGVLAWLAKWVGHPFVYTLTQRQMGVLALVYYSALAIALAGKLMWVHRAWKALPQGCRVTALGEWVTPDEAAYMHLVPWRGFTWQFTAHLGVAEATNAVLASYDTDVRASTRLPMVACTTLLLPGINFLVFPALLLAHMESVDRAQREMEHCLTARQHVQGFVPPQRPTGLSWVKPLLAASLLTWIGVPFVIIELLDLRAGASTDATSTSTTAVGPIKTPEHVELHSDRIAQAMTDCARADGNEVPKSFEACAAVTEPLKAAAMAGGARYSWDDHGVLTAWWPEHERVWAKRHVSCTPQRGCEYQREKFGL